MARQRNPSGGFSPSSAGIGQQIMYSPEWADIDFADFQGLNMGLINQNAQFAQEVANKRLDEVLKQRDAILEKVKLHKRFDDLQGQLDNKLGAIIDNMGQLQLSDSANFTSLNTSLIKAKNDPVLQGAVQASQDAMSYEKMKFEKPEIAEQPWNNANEGNYQKFLRGETNDFTFNPIYKEYDLQTKADEFAKAVPADVQNAIVKYGLYGLQEKAIEDKSAGKLLTAFNSFKQGLMQDPEFQSWYNRRGNYEKTRGSSIDDVINNMFKSSAAKYGTTTPTVKVGMPREDVDISTGIQLSENARAQARFNAEQSAGFPSSKGTTKGPKPSLVDYSNTSFVKNGDKMEQGEKINALSNYLTKAVSMTKDKTGKTITSKPKITNLKGIDAKGNEITYKAEEYSSGYTPTGNFRDNMDGTVSIIVESKTGKTGEIKALKTNFENSITGNIVTPTGTVPSYLETK
jgi:hypothetical protein